MPILPTYLARRDENKGRKGGLVRAQTFPKGGGIGSEGRPSRKHRPCPSPGRPSPGSQVPVRPSPGFRKGRGLRREWAAVERVRPQTFTVRPMTSFGFGSRGSTSDLDGQAGGFELGDAAGLVVFGGGGKGEGGGVVGGAHAFVLAFADVVVGKEVHFVWLAVKAPEEGGGGRRAGGASVLHGLADDIVWFWESWVMLRS